MTKPLTIRIWIDGKLDREFETMDDSWLETGYIKIHEGGKVFAYAGNLSKARTISFAHNSETLIKEAFNLDSLELASK